ncbi:MAG: hypothetical protein IKI11_09080, partial [Neisseriaceae bacterium]|nr:hypothetical protein [Neisseriaceae bacterium]
NRTEKSGVSGGFFKCHTDSLMLNAKSLFKGKPLAIPNPCDIKKSNDYSKLNILATLKTSF